MYNCKAFTNHLCLNVSGSLQPCCRFEGSSFQFNYKLPDYSNLKIVNDWVVGCEKCKLEEDTFTKQSYRQYLNSILQDTNKIEYLELSLDNTCNLICKMCNPSSSSSWQDLIDRNNSLTNYISIKYNQKNEINIDKLFNEIDLSELKYVKYLGGEPFISLKIENLFKKLKEYNLINKITFITNTNLTFFPSKLITYLESFKNVIVAFSIDGIGSLNEYIRYGKSWTINSNTIRLWKNFAKTNNNISFYVHTTVQAYNLHDLTNIKNFSIENDLVFNPILLRNPKHLNINVLPLKYIQSIKNNDNEKYIDNYCFDEVNYVKFINYTKELDRIFNTDYKKINKLCNFY